MRYSLHITGITSPRAYSIVAHHLAGNRNVSLSYAQSLLENLPVVYMTDLTSEQADTALRQLINIGVKAHTVAAESGVMAAINNEDAEKKTPEIITSAPSQPSPVPITAPSKVRFVFKEEAAGFEPGKKRPPWKILMSVILALAALIGICTFFTRSQWRLAVHPPSPAGVSVETKNGNPQGIGLSGIPGAGTKDSGKMADSDSISEQDKRASQAYFDSASASATDDAVIAFYRMAISFNKYNIQAWYGLINAYNRGGKDNLAGSAREKMKRIFGESVFSLSNIVERFGALGDYRRGADGTFRLEYRSRTADTANLAFETYQIIRAFAGQCDCSALSVYATGASSRGIIVFVKNTAPLATFEQFKSVAVIRSIQ